MRIGVKSGYWVAGLAPARKQGIRDPGPESSVECWGDGDEEIMGQSLCLSDIFQFLYLTDGQDFPACLPSRLISVSKRESR
jgi:hypothetical protein